MKKVLPIFLGAFIAPMSVFADNKYEMHEPHEGRTYKQFVQNALNTMLVYPQEKAEIQLTLSPRYIKGQVPGTEYQNLTIAPFELEFGITDFWQISFGYDSYIKEKIPGFNPQTGSGNYTLGTLYSLMNINGTQNHVGFNFDVTFAGNNLSRQIIEGNREYEPSLLLAHDFPGFYDSQLYSQIGLNIVQSPTALNQEGEINHQNPSSYIFNLGYLFPLPQHNDFVLDFEYNYEANTWLNSGGVNGQYLTSGLIYHKRTGTLQIELSFGGAVGLTNTSDKYQLMGNLIYEFATV